MSKDAIAPFPNNFTKASDPGDLRRAALIAMAAVATILAIYYQTTLSMVSIWDRSDTFAHCFLIAPISAWMVWRQRKQLMHLDHRPNPWALILLVGLGFGWLLATLAHVLVFQQYFVVAMIPVAVWSILGNRLAWAIAFPMAYLLLAVPFGEVFIPSLIDFTADFTVAALQLTGIPVYREGTFFTLPTGNWSVVEACSGLRYLIASFTLGSLYAYLTYTSLKRRLAFIALSVIVPIVANGLRAYMIVMMGHLSGMTLAVGVDHLIYGWLFFGIVMLLLFWIGSFWREDDQTKSSTKTEGSRKPLHSAPIRASAGVALSAIAVILLWPAYVKYLERNADVLESRKIDIPGQPGKWEVSSTMLSNWKPTYIGTPIQFVRTYYNGSHSVTIYVAEYHNQHRGSQLITSGNTLVPEKDPEWRNVGEQARAIELASQRLTIKESRLHSPIQKLLLWRWYRLDSEETTSPYIAKMLLAKKKLLDRGDDGAEIIIAAQYEEKPDEAVPVLQSFVNDMMPDIRKGLIHASAH
jgi:exosortase A